MEKFYSLLGLCQKAGRLVSGDTKCESIIRNGKAKLVIISDDASEKTVKKYSNLKDRFNLPLITIGSKEQLGHAIGKVSRTVIVITNKSFADMVIKHIKGIKSGAGVIDYGQDQGI